MPRHSYTEDQLVEQPAIGLFAKLGWGTVSASEEAFGVGGLLGRETKGDVVLVTRPNLPKLISLNSYFSPSGEYAQSTETAGLRRFTKSGIFTLR